MADTPVETDTTVGEGDSGGAEATLPVRSVGKPKGKPKDKRLKGKSKQVDYTEPPGTPARAWGAFQKQWWPCEVCDPEKVEYDTALDVSGDNFLVFWFGKAKSFSVLPRSKLQPWDEAHEKLSKAMKSAAFVEAVAEAQKWPAFNAAEVFPKLTAGQRAKVVKPAPKAASKKKKKVVTEPVESEDEIIEYDTDELDIPSANEIGEFDEDLIWNLYYPDPVVAKKSGNTRKRKGKVALDELEMSSDSSDDGEAASAAAPAPSNGDAVEDAGNAPTLSTSKASATTENEAAPMDVEDTTKVKPGAEEPPKVEEQAAKTSSKGSLFDDEDDEEEAAMDADEDEWKPDAGDKRKATSPAKSASKRARTASADDGASGEDADAEAEKLRRKELRKQEKKNKKLEEKKEAKRRQKELEKQLANETTEEKIKRLINKMKMSLSTESKSIDDALDALKQLGEVKVTAAHLEATAEVIIAVKKCKKFADARIAQASKKVWSSWNAVLSA